MEMSLCEVAGSCASVLVDVEDAPDAAISNADTVAMMLAQDAVMLQNGIVATCAQANGSNTTAIHWPYERSDGGNTRCTDGNNRTPPVATS